MLNPPLTTDELAGLIILAIIAGAIVLYVAQLIVFGILRRASVNRSASGNPQPYVEGATDPASKSAASAPSRQEAEAEVRREVRPEGSTGIVSLTEKALQDRDAGNYQRGMIDTYATLLKGGYLAAAVQGKQIGKMKQALAAVAGHRVPLLPGLSGRQLQALNDAVNEVPDPTGDEAPEQTPIAKRELAPGVEFAKK